MSVSINKNLLNQEKLIQLAKGAVVPVLLLIFWEYMSRQSVENAYAFASIEQMYHALLEVIATQELQTSLVASLLRALTGLAIGGVLGFTIGALMATSKIVDVSIGPIYHIFRQVPLMGLVPLFGLWLGNGDTAKLFIVCLAAFYPLVLATYESLRQVETKYREVGDVLKLGRVQLFFRILLPAALPNIFTGVAFALAFAWLSTIGSEILFNAGSGLGNMMMNAEVAARMDILIVVTILIGIVGFAMNLLLSRVGRHLFRWRNLRAA
ncbi:MAG: ABC transporter permease [Methylophilaceae bacterium]